MDSSKALAWTTASIAPPSPESASCAPSDACASASAFSRNGSSAISSSYSPSSGETSSMRDSAKRASSMLSELARCASSRRASSDAARCASSHAASYAHFAAEMASPPHASSNRRCSGCLSRRWCSCCPHRSTRAPTVDASSETLAREPSIVTRLRPSDETRRTATVPSPASPSRNNRPSTVHAFAPWRTVDASARSPTSSLMAESSALFPAPVSPVITVKPRAGANVASLMSAKSFT